MIDKTKMVSFRLTEAEHNEFKNRIPVHEKGKNKGKPIMPLSTFIRGAIFKKRLVAVDREVEEYKIFSASKIGNNLNQIAHRLNSDNLAGKVTEQTYNDILAELKILRDEMYKTLAPIR